MKGIRKNILVFLFVLILYSLFVLPKSSGHVDFVSSHCGEGTGIGCVLKYKAEEWKWMMGH